MQANALSRNPVPVPAADHGEVNSEDPTSAQGQMADIIMVGLSVEVTPRRTIISGGQSPPQARGSGGMLPQENV